MADLKSCECGNAVVVYNHDSYVLCDCGAVMEVERLVNSMGSPYINLRALEGLELSLVKKQLRISDNG
jgi:hypothetical protein